MRTPIFEERSWLGRPTLGRITHPGVPRNEQPEGQGSAGNPFDAPVGENAPKLRQQIPLLRIDDAVRAGQRQNPLVFRVGELVVINGFLDQFR